MAEKKINTEEVADAVAKIFVKLEELDKEINRRFDKLKEAVIGYIDLGSEMAKGSVRETLKGI